MIIGAIPSNKAEGGLVVIGLGSHDYEAKAKNGFVFRNFSIVAKVLMQLGHPEDWGVLLVDADTDQELHDKVAKQFSKIGVKPENIVMIEANQKED